MLGLPGLAGWRQLPHKFRKENCDLSGNVIFCRFAESPERKADFFLADKYRLNRMLCCLLFNRHSRLETSVLLAFWPRNFPNNDHRRCVNFEQWRDSLVYWDKAAIAGPVRASTPVQ